ncbi:hypothetical protein MMC30_005878 [Trapelia coarctata]|nr:hypothetical protein [Trapelia coarctata]
MEHKVTRWQAALEPGLKPRETGVAASLFECTIALCSGILSRLASSNPSLKPGLYDVVRNEARLFYLWGEDYALDPGSIDETLALSRDLRGTVMSLLVNWARALFPRIFPALEWTSIQEEVKSVQVSAEKADLMVAAAALDDAPLAEDIGSGTASETESIGGDNGLDEVLKDLKAYRESLMDLVPALRMPAKDATVVEQTKSTSDVFRDVVEAFRPYVANIKEKYPSADPTFVKRLGEANFRRWRRLRDKVASAARVAAEDLEESCSDSDRVSTRPSLRRASQPLQSLPSTYQSSGDTALSSMFDSVPHRYTRSVGSATSFASSEADQSQAQGQRKVPSLPVNHIWGAPFQCIVCGEVVRRIEDRFEWNMRTYRSRREWSEHEFRLHRVDKHWRCHECSVGFSEPGTFREHILEVHGTDIAPSQVDEVVLAARRLTVRPAAKEKCPFCLKTPATTKGGFAAHVGKHMRDIALFALPPLDGNDEDESVGTDDNVDSKVDEEEAHSQPDNSGYSIEAVLGKDHLHEVDAEVSYPALTKNVPPSIKDFVILKPISKSEFASTYLSKKAGDFFAVKVLKKLDMLAKNQVTDVTAERATLMSVGEYDHVVKLFWTFASKEYLFLIMEYMGGGDCASLVNVLGGLPEAQARRFAAELILAVTYIHSRSIIHHDLMPGNILIDQRGHLKLADFGLSRSGIVGRQRHSCQKRSPSQGFSASFESSKAEPNEISPPNEYSYRPLNAIGHDSALFDLEGESDEFFGTPDYLAPEIVRGDITDGSCDFWSLGCIIFYFLLGCTPFRADNTDQVFRNILIGKIDWPAEDKKFSMAAVEVVVNLLAREPKQRPGAEKIKSFRWFGTINWETLLAEDSPYAPPLGSPDSITSDAAYPTGWSSATCEECGRIFSGNSSLSNMRRHSREQHIELRDRPTCTRCNSTFSRLDYLPRHMKRHHPEQELQKDSASR